MGYVQGFGKGLDRIKGVRDWHMTSYSRTLVDDCGYCRFAPKQSALIDLYEWILLLSLFLTFGKLAEMKLT